MFSAEELKLLSSITEGFSRRSKHAKLQNFEEFFAEFLQFVKNVEEGYTMTIDDYANDIIQRDLIDELIDDIPPSLKKKINQLVESWDNRFARATITLRNPIFKEGDQPWWWYRIPKKLIGDLKEDVERLEIK